MLNVPTYQPTWHQNLARNASEARYPSLWKGVILNLQPGLGPTGLTLHDLSGRGKNGVLTDMVPADDWVLDEGRTALLFSASNQRVLFPANVFKSAVYTVAFWANFNQVDALQALFSARTADDDSLEFFVLGSGSQLRGGQFTGGATSATNSISTAGGWHHIVLTSNAAGILQFYINGRASGVTGTTNFSTFSIALQLGSRSPADFDFDGLLDDITVSDGIARDPSDIQLLHQLGRGGWMARRQRVFAKAPAAPTGVTIPVLDHHYQQMRAA